MVKGVTNAVRSTTLKSGMQRVMDQHGQCG